MARQHRWQIRQPAVLSKLRSSAQGLLRLLSATTAKSISEVKPSNKRGAHHFACFVVELSNEMPKIWSSSHCFAAFSCYGVELSKEMPEIARHQRLRIRQPALLSKLRSSAQGLLRLLSATTAKSISEVKPSNKRGAHQIAEKRLPSVQFLPLFWTDTLR